MYRQYGSCHRKRLIMKMGRRNSYPTILIVGTGHCGTSLVAKYFHVNKFSICNWMDEERRRGMEDHLITQINLNLKLCYQANPAEDEFDKIKKEILKIRWDVIKSPGFFHYYCPKTWTVWNAVNNIKVLVISRDFLETSKSAFRDDSQYFFDNNQEHVTPLCTNPTEEGLTEYLKNTYNMAVAGLDDNKVPYRVLRYPDICFDFDLLYNPIKELDISLGNYEDAKYKWFKLVDLKK